MYRTEKTRPATRHGFSLRFAPALMMMLLGVLLLVYGGRAASVSSPSDIADSRNVGSASRAGICSNPYYPVTTGTKRVYRNTTAAGTGTLTYTYSQFGVAGFTENVETEHGTTVVRNWYCEEGGMTQDFAGNVSTGKLQITFVRVSGVTIPGPSQWRVGAKWQTVYKGNGHIGSMEVGGSATAISTITGSGMEAVEAGTFQAFKVETVVTQEMIMSLSPALPMQSGKPTKYTVTSWYAKDVGLVKSVTEGSSTELISFANK